jgi:hypothetical protein
MQDCAQEVVFRKSALLPIGQTEYRPLRILSLWYWAACPAVQVSMCRGLAHCREGGYIRNPLGKSFNIT